MICSCRLHCTHHRRALHRQRALMVMIWLEIMYDNIITFSSSFASSLPSSVGCSPSSWTNELFFPCRRRTQSLKVSWGQSEKSSKGEKKVCFSFVLIFSFLFLFTVFFVFLSPLYLFCFSLPHNFLSQFFLFSSDFLLLIRFFSSMIFHFYTVKWGARTWFFIARERLGFLGGGGGGGFHIRWDGRKSLNSCVLFYFIFYIFFGGVSFALSLGLSIFFNFI